MPSAEPWTLRLPEPSDRPALRRWRRDPASALNLLWSGGPASTDEEVEAWISRRTSDPHGWFRIVADASGRPVGFVQLTDVNRRSRRCSAGIRIDEAARGKGLGRAVWRALEAVARDELGCGKVSLEVLAANEPARRFFASLGYRLVGRLEAHHSHDGRLHDVLLLERRLDAAPPPAAEVTLPPIPNDPATVQAMARDPEVAALRARLVSLMGTYRYAYDWTWWGRPVIQLPQDLVAMQTLILAQRPDLIIETGVAHGGSTVFYASMLELLGRGRVVGIDLEVRPHNRAALDAHPLRGRIELIEGSAIDPAIAARAAAMAEGAERVFVCLDSNHTADHVARELELYAPLVRPGGYLVVFDTLIEDLPASAFPDRPWGPGNSPRTAVDAFLRTTRRFVVDEELERRLLFSVAPGGYLRCVS